MSLQPEPFIIKDNISYFLSYVSNFIVILNTTVPYVRLKISCLILFLLYFKIFTQIKYIQRIQILIMFVNQEVTDEAGRNLLD